MGSRAGLEQLGWRVAWVIALGAASLVGLPGRALAGSAGVLPPGGDPHMTAVQAGEVVQAASLALAELGHSVLTPDELSARLSAAGQDPCAEVDCASRVLAALGLDVVVMVRVWLHDDRSPREVSARATGQLGHGSAIVPVHVGDLATAVGTATARAAADIATAGRVPIEVVGEPAGATVSIDHRPVGRLPYSGWVTPGPREVSVSMAGYATTTREVAVAVPAEDARAPVVVEVALTPGGAAGGRGAGAQGLLLGAGAASAAVAVGAFALAGYGLLGAGEACTASAGAACTERRARETDVAATATYGAVGVVAAVAALWLLVEALAGDEPGSTARLGLDGLSVSF